VLWNSYSCTNPFSSHHFTNPIVFSVTQGNIEAKRGSRYWTSYCSFFELLCWESFGCFHQGKPWQCPIKNSEGMYVIQSVAANNCWVLIYHWHIFFAPIVTIKLHNFIFYVQGHESSQTPKSTKGQKLNNTAASRKGLSTYSHLTSDGIWSNIKEFTKSKYQVFHFFRVLKLLYLKNTLVVMFSFL